MIRSELAELSAFATVAEERSFTRAAARLGISQSALSHSIRGLEKRLGIQLLARTTRSVSPTAAGTALLQELAPALERIERAVAETRKQRENPAGRIRLIIPRTATQMVILRKLARFSRTYPEIILEITSSNDPVDLVAGESSDGNLRGCQGRRRRAAFILTLDSPASHFTIELGTKRNAVQLSFVPWWSGFRSFSSLLVGIHTPPHCSGVLHHHRLVSVTEHSGFASNQVLLENSGRRHPTIAMLLSAL